MNLPNRLTLLRVCLIPVFVALMMAGNDFCRVLSALVFLLASLTDFLDGYLARKRNLVTNFGKLMDPMADKLLVMASLIGYMMYQHHGALEIDLLREPEPDAASAAARPVKTEAQVRDAEVSALVQKSDLKEAASGVLA